MCEIAISKPKCYKGEQYGKWYCPLARKRLSTSVLEIVYASSVWLQGIANNVWHSCVGVLVYASSVCKWHGNPILELWFQPSCCTFWYNLQYGNFEVFMILFVIIWCRKPMCLKTNQGQLYHFHGNLSIGQ